MGMNYGDGLNSSNGSNVRIDALREKAIRMAKRDIVFEQLMDKQTMPLNYGKTLKVHKTLYILDDANTNDQGLGPDGVKPGAGEPNENGNLYGSSRSVVDVSNGMPLLAEGAGRANRVGMTRITIQGTLTRMGAFLEYTDEVELFSDQKMEVQYYEKMGELAAELYDDYLQTELLGSAGIEVYGGVATSLLELEGNDAQVASTFSYDLISAFSIVLKTSSEFL
jgi:N4-gp56 family major capsid protein